MAARWLSGTANEQDFVMTAPLGPADREEAKRLLQSALAGFAEGSETADIEAASEILGRL